MGRRADDGAPPHQGGPYRPRRQERGRANSNPNPNPNPNPNRNRNQVDALRLLLNSLIKSLPSLMSVGSLLLLLLFIYTVLGVHLPHISPASPYISLYLPVSPPYLPMHLPLSHHISQVQLFYGVRLNEYLTEDANFTRFGIAMITL